MSSSTTFGPYESAVSIRLMPSSMQRRKILRAPSRSFGAPHTPGQLTALSQSPGAAHLRRQVETSLQGSLSISFVGSQDLVRSGLQAPSSYGLPGRSISTSSRPRNLVLLREQRRDRLNHEVVVSNGEGNDGDLRAVGRR